MSTSTSTPVVTTTPAATTPAATGSPAAGIGAVLAASPVVPVIVVDDVATAVPLARALVDGGIPVLEVTLRTPAGLDAIARIAAEVPDAIVGAGTVLDPHDVEASVRAGARFVVSPGTTPELLDAVAEFGVPALPGVSSAGELMGLAARGFDHAKFFPAEPAGGVAYLKALAGPFPGFRFCPTGGIGQGNAADYLALPNVSSVGGSWLAPRDAVAAGDWDRIRSLARGAAALRTTARA